MSLVPTIAGASKRGWYRRLGLYLLSAEFSWHDIHYILHIVFSFRRIFWYLVWYNHILYQIIASFYLSPWSSQQNNTLVLLLWVADRTGHIAFQDKFLTDAEERFSVFPSHVSPAFAPEMMELVRSDIKEKNSSPRRSSSRNSGQLPLWAAYGSPLFFGTDFAVKEEPETSPVVPSVDALVEKSAAVKWRREAMNRK